jgi:hypothetical protein
MLNKNQSKKRNSWKYYAVIPALAAFVLLFQIEVIAKEKQLTVKEVSGEIKSVDVYKIKKNSTDANLNEIKEKLKKLHNVDFEVSEIKRNSNSDLTSLKVNIKNGKQTAQSIQTGENSPIKDFAVIVTTNKDDSKSVGIQTYDEIKNSKTDGEPKVAISKKLQTKTETNGSNNSNVSAKTNTNTNTNTSTTVIVNSDNDTKVITTTKGSTSSFSNGTKVSINETEKLIVVDGKEMPSGFDYNDINSKDIKSVNVYTGTNAVSKYGEKGANGVIEIETRK